MTDPIKLPDLTQLMKDADRIVKDKPTYAKFIDGTPLSNDIAVWMAVFAHYECRLAVEQNTAELRARCAELEAAMRPFVEDYENGDTSDLKYYARAMRAALKEKQT